MADVRIPAAITCGPDPKARTTPHAGPLLDSAGPRTTKAAAPLFAFCAKGGHDAACSAGLSCPKIPSHEQRRKRPCNKRRSDNRWSSIDARSSIPLARRALRCSVFLGFVFLALAVMTQAYAHFRDDAVFPQEHCTPLTFFPKAHGGSDSTTHVDRECRRAPTRYFGIGRYVRSIDSCVALLA
jgi:hypothetical protein